MLELVLDQVAYGRSADEMHEQHPALSLAQIHAALAFYHDHQREFDAHMAADHEAIRKLRASCGESSLHRRLRALTLAK